MTTAAAGKLPGYETTIITRAEMSDEGLKTLMDRLHGVVAQYNGQVVLSEDWGKRKMAYSIQKESRGQYTYIVYSGKGDVVHEMERNLRLHDHVLRFLTVNLEKEFDGEIFAKRRADLQAAAKRREEEREARREERFAERRHHDDYRGHGDDHRGPRADADAFEEPAGASDEE